MTVSTKVTGSIIVIFVTLGLAIRLGNSTFSQMFPGLKLFPTTAQTSPDTCCAYEADISSHACIDAGLSKSLGISIPLSLIADSNVTPFFDFAILSATSAPPTPSVLPDQKNAESGSVFN